MNLYEITQELKPLYDALDESGGELTPDVEAALEKIEGDYSDKVEKIVRVIRNLQSSHDAKKGESDFLGASARTDGNAVERLKSYLKQSMELLGKCKVDAGLFRVRIQANSAPSVKYDGPFDQLPADFVRMLPSLDKTKVLDAAAAGKPLPAGVVVERGSHLRIS